MGPVDGVVVLVALMLVGVPGVGAPPEPVDAGGDVAAPAAVAIGPPATLPGVVAADTDNVDDGGVVG